MTSVEEEKKNFVRASTKTKKKVCRLGRHVLKDKKKCSRCENIICANCWFPQNKEEYSDQHCQNC